MKKTGIINRELCALVATLGHLDEITLCDAGLPCPPGVPVIDLSLTYGTPRLWPVLDALRQDLVIEGAVWADEADSDLAKRFQSELALWETSLGKPVIASLQSHETFKERTARSRAIIRTGETTPYANVILICGVVF